MTIFSNDPRAPAEEDARSEHEEDAQNDSEADNSVAATRPDVKYEYWYEVTATAVEELQQLAVDANSPVVANSTVVAASSPAVVANEVAPIATAAPVHLVEQAQPIQEVQPIQHVEPIQHGEPIQPILEAQQPASNLDTSDTSSLEFEYGSSLGSDSDAEPTLPDLEVQQPASYLDTGDSSSLDLEYGSSIGSDSDGLSDWAQPLQHADLIQAMHEAMLEALQPASDLVNDDETSSVLEFEYGSSLGGSDTDALSEWAAWEVVDTLNASRALQDSVSGRSYLMLACDTDDQLFSLIDILRALNHAVCVEQGEFIDLEEPAYPYDADVDSDTDNETSCENQASDVLPAQPQQAQAPSLRAQLANVDTDTDSESINKYQASDVIPVQPQQAQAPSVSTQLADLRPETLRASTIEACFRVLLAGLGALGEPEMRDFAAPYGSATQTDAWRFNCLEIQEGGNLMPTALPHGMRLLNPRQEAYHRRMAAEWELYRNNWNAYLANQPAVLQRGLCPVVADWNEFVRQEGHDWQNVDEIVNAEFPGSDDDEELPEWA